MSVCQRKAQDEDSTESVTILYHTANPKKKLSEENTLWKGSGCFNCIMLYKIEEKQLDPFFLFF